MCDQRIVNCVILGWKTKNRKPQELPKMLIAQIKHGRFQWLKPGIEIVLFEDDPAMAESWGEPLALTPEEAAGIAKGEQIRLSHEGEIAWRSALPPGRGR